MGLKALVKENPTVYQNAIKLSLGLKSLIPDKTYIKRQYKQKTGRELNLTHPETFNDKIQWLKLYWRNELCTTCADKYAVRQYVEDRLGKDVLNELYGIYAHANEIDLSTLPSSFVLKVTHGSGQNVLCADKSTINWKETARKLNRFLLNNHYFHGREWAYKNIPPRIICERYLDEDGKPPKDYKFFCFNGHPKIVQVDVDRFDGHGRNMYDTEWNLLDFEFQYPRSTEEVQKPLYLDKMIEYASKLSANIPFVRVDFYHVNNRIYFGEMTFHPENGTGQFSPQSYDDLLGSYLELPKK